MISILHSLTPKDLENSICVQSLSESVVNAEYMICVITDDCYSNDVLFSSQSLNTGLDTATNV